MVTYVRYVLDANVVSALRRPEREPAVARWAEPIPVGDLYITAPTVAELGLGVAAMERRDPAAGALLRRWFESAVLAVFSDRVLPFDRQAALILASYRVPEHAPYDDALIAAVVQANGMTLATRNTRHFAPLGIALVDPWECPATP